MAYTGASTLLIKIPEIIFNSTTMINLHLIKEQTVGRLFNLHCRVAAFKPCKERQCKNGATCSPSNGTFECTCARDYYGSTCEGTTASPYSVVMYYLADPFSHYVNVIAITYTKYHTFICYRKLANNLKQCTSSWMINEEFYDGLLFSEYDPCRINPCSGKGICVNEAKSFKCECIVDYYGRTCSGKIKQA